MLFRSNEYLQYRVTGNDLSTDYADLNNTFRVNNAAFFNNCDSKLLSQGLDSLDRENIFDSMEECYKKLDTIKNNYVMNHPEKDLSALFILERDFKESAKLIPNLSANVRNGILKEALDDIEFNFEQYKAVEDNISKMQPGNKAPVFSLKDVNGKPVLSEMYIGNKYIILDFWGTWCYWCMKGVPDMKEYYDKYRHKVEFIGINCNDKPEACFQAIYKNEMNWVNIINDSNPEKDMVRLFAVNSFPTKVIISPDGLIAGYFQGESKEFYEKLDELLK